MEKISRSEKQEIHKTVILSVPQWSEDPVEYHSVGGENGVFWFVVDGIPSGVNSTPYARFQLTELEEEELWNTIYS